MPTSRDTIMLPDTCYSVLLSTRQLIRIDRGEDGYVPMRMFDEHVFDKEADRLAKELNIGLGVSNAQRGAMEHGSMFGWDTPEADPEHKINQLAAY